MKKYLLAAITLSCMASVAMAANWKFVDKAERSGTKYYVDTTSIAKSPFGRKAWVWMEHGKPQELSSAYPKKYYTSETELDHCNCQERTYSIAQIIRYAGTGRSGDVVGSVTREPTRDDFKDVVPDSVGEGLLDFVCSFKMPD